MYKLVDSIPELNTEEIKENLEEDGGLCPCCSKRVNNNNMMASFTNDHGVFYYLICGKCVQMLNKVDDKLRNNKKILIEENLINNIAIYAALLIRNEPVLDAPTDHMISVLNNNRAEWVIDDREFFKQNPERKFRCRKIYFGELEETYIDKPHLRNDAGQKGIRYALVHNVGYDQLVKSFVNDISDYPIDDENFVAALFIVLVQRLDSSKIMDIYKDITERKHIFKDLESLKTYY